MREGWSYKKLGEVSEAFIGLTYKPEDVAESGTIVLRSSNIQNFKLDFKDLVRVNIPINEAKYVQNGDILMCSRNGSFSLLGKTAMVNNLFEPMSFGAFMTIIRSDYNDYLLHFFRSSIFRQKLLLGKTSTVNQITVKMLKDTIIPLPPLTIQQQIVSELDLLSHILDQKRQQLKEYDALAESIFYDMFGDESKFKKEKLVKLTTKIGSGATPKGGNQAYKDEGISLIRSLNVHNAEFKYEDLAHIDEEQAAALNNVTLEKNDVLFNITGASVTRCCIVPENVLPARVNQHVAILRPCTEVLNYIFLSHLLISSHYHDKLYALSRSNGATREAITKAQLENFVIPLPPLDLQRSFASKIESIEHQKQLLRASIKETEMLFQSRMDYWFNS